MLTFLKRRPGIRGPTIPRLLVIFFVFVFVFFLSIRPTATQYQETHSTVNKEKKGGWPNHDKNLICV